VECVRKAVYRIAIVTGASRSTGIGTAICNRGPILLSTEFAKRFEKNQVQGTAGRVIFMVSKGHDPNNLAYTATKSALIG
jgi:NAD(P)-dependent dehydrogenase (short-subunit alcohol dehydrogenase family)